MSGWLHSDGDIVVLKLLNQLGAITTAIIDQCGDALKICIATPPFGGKTKSALYAFIAVKVSICRTAVAVISGLGVHAKGAHVKGIAAADALKG